MSNLDMVSEEKTKLTDFRNVKHLRLYREFQAERDEILKHKYLESQKVGYDVGFEWALTDWIIKHRSKWRKWRMEQIRKQPQD